MERLRWRENIDDVPNNLRLFLLPFMDVELTAGEEEDDEVEWLGGGGEAEGSDQNYEELEPSDDDTVEAPVHPHRPTPCS